MDQNAHFNLPFFEDHHRRLAAEFGEWTERELRQYQSPGSDLESDVYGLTQELVAKLGRAGWLRYCVPASHGGAFATLDSRSLCIQREILSRCFALSDAALSMQGIGSAGITFFGDAEIQQRYLPKVLAGETIGALALTEPQSGSDVANTQTTVTPDGDGYVINGHKAWISNADIAHYYIVIARSGEAPGAKGLSAFVVDADNPGLAVTERTQIMAPHPVGCLEFRNCRVPASSRLGKPGEGFRIGMATLDVFRPTAAAAALGLARRALDEAMLRVQDRQLFGKPLSAFQNTQMKIADMAVDIDAAALLIYRAAWIKDCSTTERPTRSASMAKLYASEAAGRVVDNALQLFGGMGVKSGLTIERLYREARVMRIYEGTSEIQRLIIGGDVIAAAAKS